MQHRTGRGGNPSSSGFEKKKKEKEVCYIEGGLEMIRRSAKNPRPIGLKRHRSSSARRSVLSAALCRGCQVCGCEGCGNRFTLEYGNRIHTFTCYLLGFPPDFHTVSIPVTLESKEEIGLCGASTVEIFELVSLGGRSADCTFKCLYCTSTHIINRACFEACLLGFRATQYVNMVWILFEE